MDLKRLYDDLIRHEGLRLKPYRCTAGKLTIGVGRNLDDVGISPAEALMMLKNDVDALMADLELREIIAPHNEVRQEVLVNMAFNMGVPRLKGFKKMLAALQRMDYEEAARQALDSKWAKQVGGRAIELAEKLRTGEA